MLGLAIAFLAVVPVHAGAQSAEDSAGRGTGGGPPAVLARIGGRAVTLEDVRARSGAELDRLRIGYERERQKLIEATLRQILRDSLFSAESAKRGRTVDELVLAEAGGSLDPTEVEIATWYQENPDRIQGRPLVQMHNAIAAFLRDQRREAASHTLEDRLFREAGVMIELQPYRVPLDLDGAPARGRADAPVTLVEFSDFQCPFCGGFFGTLEQVRKAFADTVRIVYLQFPLSSIHPNAEKAAEASLCANEQGKFWQMHDLMFHEQDRLSVSELKEKAARLGLDAAAFEGCLDSGRQKGRVERDRTEGLRVGVNGTPAVFIDGISVEGGAVSFDVLSRMIHEELRRRGP